MSIQKRSWRSEILSCLFQHVYCQLERWRNDASRGKTWNYSGNCIIRISQLWKPRTSQTKLEKHWRQFSISTMQERLFLTRNCVIGRSQLKTGFQFSEDDCTWNTKLMFSLFIRYLHVVRSWSLIWDDSRFWSGGGETIFADTCVSGWGLLFGLASFSNCHFTE